MYNIKLLFSSCPTLQSFLQLYFILLVSQMVNSYNYKKDNMAAIILVPGLGNSQIEGQWHTHDHPKHCDKKGDWQHFWLNFEMAIQDPGSLKCWAFRFKLLYDRTTHTCTNQVGVTTRVKGKFGSLKCCEYLTESPVSHLFQQSQYFHKMVKTLKKRGYSTDHSLKAACYDWRYAPPQLAEFGYVAQLTSLVEHAADTKRKVAIAAHSMGGLVTAYFLQNQTQEWKDKHIHAFITSGTPWLGSPKAFGNYILGATYGIKTIRKSTMRDLIRTLQATAFLLPQEEAYTETVLVETQKRNYTSKDYQQFFTDIAYEDAYLMRQDLRALFPVPLDKLGLRYICVWTNTSTVETPETFRVDAATMNDTDKMDVVVYTEGDKRVPLRSLRYCEKFKDVTVKSFQGYDHNK